MTDQEFYSLIVRWEETPECKEYYEYCDKHNDNPTTAEMSTCFTLMIKALSNDLGKQLVQEKKFQEILLGNRPWN